jgi:phytoene dehydrogenase-like protein
MTDFMDTALNYQPGIRIAPSRKWVMTNGTIQMDVCTVCAQPYREGHRNCSCPSNHPDPCERPTYDELLRVGQHDDFDPFTPAERFAHQRRIADKNADFAWRYRDLLQKLLDRHNSDGDSLPKTAFALTILSPADVAEIKAALDWLGD